MRDEAATRHPDHGSHDCGSGDCGSGKRNRFFRGKQMRAEEFKIEQRHMVERRRLINRAVLGWGVVYGFKLKLHDTHPPQHAPTTAAQQAATPGAPVPPPPAMRKKLKIGRGFALDRHGRETVLEHRLTLDAGNTFLLSEDGCEPRKISEAKPGRYVLAIHYAERAIEDSKSPWGCGCGKPEKKYICETVAFSLRPLGDHACPCPELHCHRHCKCPDRDDACGTAGRGPHSCLCQWLKHAEIAGEASPAHGWQGLCVDPHAGVDLACITLGEFDSKCEPIAVTAIDDDCGPRRLVKSNDLLYDLARGCDLTKIETISWDQWHRDFLKKEPPVPLWRFFEFFGTSGQTEFTVDFSGPVLTRSIMPNALIIRVYTQDPGTGWRVPMQVPIDSLLDESDSRKTTTKHICVYVSPEWIRDELTGKNSILRREDDNFLVEVEVRGTILRDCHNQALDADPGFESPTPSGNGTPGGVFLSSFLVDPKQNIKPPVSASSGS
ncbi:hypothetical protein [Dongia sp.]|uniref:hypothetical protein n=1 Tax=Dongia sp. TaxID=1977262 RepID=UPI00375067F9